MRVPAALCGLVGLKVTHGRIPLTGVFPLAPSLDTVGPLTRTVGDAALAYLALAGTDPADPWSLSEEVTTPRGAGGASHLDANHPDRYGPDVHLRLERALAMGPRERAAGLAWRARVRQALDDLLARCDAVLLPTTAVGRKEIGSDEVVTEEGPLPYRRALSTFTAPVNHSGHPALALPLASPVACPNDPPPSLQLIGRRGEEHRLLEVGLALEAAGVVGFRWPEGAERL